MSKKYYHIEEIEQILKPYGFEVEKNYDFDPTDVGIIGSIDVFYNDEYVISIYDLGEEVDDSINIECVFKNIDSFINHPKTEYNVKKLVLKLKNIFNKFRRKEKIEKVLNN